MAGNEDYPQDVMLEIQKLRSEMLEDREERTTKNADILEKLQSIEELVSKNQTESVMDTKDTVVPTDLSSDLSRNITTEKTTVIAKSFVLKHVFKNVEEFENDKANFSDLEEHFGAKWCINLTHQDNNLAFYLHVLHPGKDWEIETIYDLKIIEHKIPDMVKRGGYRFKESIGYGFNKVLKWGEMKKDYLVDGNLTAEAHVKIIETRGLRKEKIRSFDESVKEVSDFVLVVKDRRFYVNKTFLAAQSSFFKALLLGNFSESKKSEVTLTGIDPEDFHFFLEVLYGELAIDESNVEGIALLADMYDAPTAVRRCEEFMLNNSKKNLKRKLQIADQYHLGALKKKCLSDIKTSSDLRAVLPNNIEDLEHSTIATLLQQAVFIMHDRLLV